MPSVILGICFGTTILWIASRMYPPPTRNSNNIIRNNNTNTDT